MFRINLCVRGQKIHTHTVKCKLTLGLGFVLWYKIEPIAKDDVYETIFNTIKVIGSVGRFAFIFPAETMINPRHAGPEKIKLNGVSDDASEVNGLAIPCLIPAEAD